MNTHSHTPNTAARLAVLAAASLSVAILAVACLAASVALADEIPAVKVEVSRPLDQAHAAQAYHRIQAAAGQVCEKLDSQELNRHLMYRRCVDEAVGRAVADLRSAEVAKIHLSERAGVTRE